MKTTFTILFFVLVSSTASLAIECSQEKAFPIITKAELKKISDEKSVEKSAFIVDVNSEESFAEAHVPGAIHFGSHKKDFTTLLPKDKNKMIVAYCGGPSCMSWHQAAEIACTLGYTNVVHFKEGISGWKKN